MFKCNGPYSPKRIFTLVIFTLTTFDIGCRVVNMFVVKR